jgi:hypothetical protein
MSEFGTKVRGPLKRIPLKGQTPPERPGAESPAVGPLHHPQTPCPASAQTNELARGQFARTFADVLSQRYGGRWSVEWKRADHAALAADRHRRALAGEE